ncbi:hypothetical protein [Bosea vaviloviae]|uniref:hypothetical protein n=1 Tax=Bosea vaviloviae TaxID=1526658 RepID=UPI0011DF5273|nr:hypothetical protein [Bosea vaviloviae]
MVVLSQNGRRLLRLLVSCLDGAVAGNPKTYITYKEVHTELGLPLHRGVTYGISLQHQGLNDLADFIEGNGLPRITGLIVEEQSREPGAGYARLLGSKELDYQQWNTEIERSKEKNWDRYIVG